jgi:predicted lactoylglutathione lyase
VFINLPVKELERSKAFFAGLGFGFDPRFTDDKAACMILNEEAFVMLLVEGRFRDFTKKRICDTAAFSEGIFALSVDSRAEVDEMVKTAVAAGGTHALAPMDYGFMYGWSFYDLDGHHWEVIWMDPAHLAR